MIQLKNLHKSYPMGKDSLHVLKGLHLHIKEGEFVSIMGSSGSGKSTLLNIIALLDQPTSGLYKLNNQEVTSLNDEDLAKARRENIGFVFQFFHLIPRYTAAENIEIPMILAGIAAKERKQRVEEALIAVNLQQRATHRPDQLSGGQTQRVAIARAMIMEPQILLADEPTGNLDSHSGMEIIELLESLNQQQVTLLMITHDEAIGRRAQRRVRIIDGQICDL